jgi:hypothetical protein
MRRLALLLAALFALVPVAPAEARPLARVKLSDCRQPDAAAATFTGEMRAVSGTKRMAMRFVLVQRMGGRKFDRVQVPGLSVWHRSTSARKVFVWDQRIANLTAVGSYRTIVQFRWYGEDGRRLRSAVRRSPVCGPTAPLPNLRVLALTTRPGATPGTAIYDVQVTNTGGSVATGVDLVLRVDSAVVDAARIERIAPGETRSFEYGGPACRDRARLVLDPQGTVIESSERDNQAVLDC